MATKSFLGTGWSFPPTFLENLETVQMVTDEEDIEQSLRILLSTYPGERITNLEYGCDLRSMILQPFNSATDARIRDIITMAIMYFEPRVKLNEIKIDSTSERDGLLKIKLFYTVIKTNIRYNIVYPFYKIEGTSIKESDAVFF
ncbi:MAG: GPW/gp25 family protein [Saprospiraceae bacterium]|nr:GPW/gp25 family protein [Saprospiraceae bacterium]